MFNLLCKSEKKIPATDNAARRRCKRNHCECQWTFLPAVCVGLSALSWRVSSESEMALCVWALSWCGIVWKRTTSAEQSDDYDLGSFSFQLINVFANIEYVWRHFMELPYAFICANWILTILLMYLMIFVIYQT